MTSDLDRFKRAVNGAAGIYYRLDTGAAGGRNARATDAALVRHVAAARGVLKENLDDEAAEVWSYLDSHPAFAAKWRRVERRFFGLT